ncbi:MAG: hypothetical protein PHP86_07555 [Nevskiales bacterium]|nr:hypothetical protein [Nevskiales bacterium]
MTMIPAQTRTQLVSLLRAALLLPLSATAAGNSAPTAYPGIPVDEAVSGQSVFPGISGSTLDAVGGEYGAKVWVDTVVERVTLNNNLLDAYNRIGGEAMGAALNDIVLKMLLGVPLEADDATLQALHKAQMTEGQINQLIEAALDSCEDTHVSFRTCTRLIMAMGPLKDILSPEE